ncbi:MAG: FAD binding domain-containing protein [Stellaceae bacterium]
MKPAQFAMHRPRTLTEALDILDAEGEGARLIAGGQSLVPMMNLRLATPAVLIDLNRVAGLADIREDGDVIRIGAAARQQALLESELIRSRAPLLAAAVRHTGHLATRCRGTVGGNLAHADPASELVLAAITLRGQVTLQSKQRTREVPAEGFFRDTLTTAIEPGEILTELSIPAAPAGTKAVFREHARRAGDFAIAAAAGQRTSSGDVLQVAVGAVAPVPRICRHIEGAHDTGRLAGAIDALVAAEIEEIEPIADIRSGASYRRKLAFVCLNDCLREVLA